MGVPGDVGEGQEVVDAELAAAGFDLVEEGGEFAAVVFADELGVDLEAGAVFHVFEGDGAVVAEVGFGAVEDLQDDHLVAGVLEVLQGEEEVVGIVEEVGDEDDQAAAGDFVGEVMEGIGDVGGFGGGELFEAFEDLIEVAGAVALGDVEADVGVEGGEADEILLAGEHVGEGGGEDGGVFEFRGAGGGGGLRFFAFGLRGGGVAEGHGGGGVEADGGAEVGFLLVLLNVVAVGAGEDGPVEVFEFIAGDVFAVLGELDGEAFVGGFVEAGESAFDDAADGEFEAAELGGLGGAEEFVAVGHGGSLTWRIRKGCERCADAAETEAGVFGGGDSALGMGISYGRISVRARMALGRCGSRTTVNAGFASDERCKFPNSPWSIKSKSWS